MRLKPGGRAAILTFHSGEDKLVKAALKEGYRAGVYYSVFQGRGAPVCAGVRAEPASPLHEDALGGPRGRVK